VDPEAIRELGLRGWRRRTGIELALSAWESVPSGLLGGLICGGGCPLVTARDRSSPGLMARQPRLSSVDVDPEVWDGPRGAQSAQPHQQLGPRSRAHRRFSEARRRRGQRVETV